jgi:ATP-binding cassette subfamily F protein uup
MIFDQLDMTITAGQKIALIAANGAGKTTLLRTIMGLETYPEGTITRSDKIRIGRLSQESSLDDEQQVIDILFGDDTPRAQAIKTYEHIMAQPELDQHAYERVIHRIDQLNAREYEAHVRTVIAQLQLTPYLDQRLGDLSGGEHKRIALAKVLIQEPTFLLLDEPTNHLDLQMIEWLEDYIRRNDLTLLMVTHDRYFLERVCSDIYELEMGQIHTYPGNYSYYLHHKAKRDAQEALEYHQLKQLYKSELQRMKTAPRGRQSKSTYRAKKFETIHDSYQVARNRSHAKAKTLELSSVSARMGGKLVKIHNISKSYGEKQLISDFSYEFHQGERVGVLGPNGSGKSTLIKIIQ